MSYSSEAPPLKRQCIDEEEDEDDWKEILDELDLPLLGLQRPWDKFHKPLLFGELSSKLKEEASHCKELRFQNMTKEALSRLVDFFRLRKLVLEMGLIENISALAGLHELRILDMNENSIKDISPLSGLTLLTDLNLRRNEIADIQPLAQLENLTALKLEENEISDISPLSKLHKLTYLDLSENMIIDVSPLACLHHLGYLSLWANKVRNLSPLSGLLQLRPSTELYWTGWPAKLHTLGNPIESGEREQLSYNLGNNRFIFAMASAKLQSNRNSPIGRSFILSPLTELFILQVIARFYE